MQNIKYPYQSNASPTTSFNEFRIFQIYSPFEISRTIVLHPKEKRKKKNYDTTNSPLTFLSFATIIKSKKIFLISNIYTFFSYREKLATFGYNISTHKRCCCHACANLIPKFFLPNSSIYSHRPTNYTLPIVSQSLPLVLPISPRASTPHTDLNRVKPIRDVCLPESKYAPSHTVSSHRGKRRFKEARGFLKIRVIRRSPILPLLFFNNFSEIN